MDSYQKFRKWLYLRWPLILLLAIILLVGKIPELINKPRQPITHTFASSTQQVDVLWFREYKFSNMFTTNGRETAFTMPLSQDSLISIDIKSGIDKWQIPLPFERSGARGLLANQSTLFTVDSTRADGYEATTGELKWSTKLGDGHVSVIPQLDSNVLRIYLGDELIELDPQKGKILARISKGDTTWVLGNIILQATSTHHLSAVNKIFGETLWTNDRLFDVSEGQEPLDIGNNNLLVGFIKGICALNLQTGKYDWCHPEIYITNIAIDAQSQLGYAMRDDLVLLTIDLHTGNVLGETRFLSSQPINEQIGFMSSITASNGVVIITFSDSNQTFGLKFK